MGLLEMHTLKEVSPGVVIGITSAIKPTPRTIRALADMLRGRNPGLSVSHRDSASGMWFVAVVLTDKGEEVSHEY